MPKKIDVLCHKIFESWHAATLYDYAMLTAWVLVAGFLISKLTSYSTK